ELWPVLDQADPAADPEALVAGRVLDDPVERDVVAHDDRCHFSAPFVCVLSYYRPSATEIGSDRLELLLSRFSWSAGQQERERQADPGQHDAGQEGGPEALVEYDKRVRACVRSQVVVGAGNGDRGGDRDAERSADLEGCVAGGRGEPGLGLGNASERRDRGGHESEADPGTQDEQPEEDVAEVAAADGDLRE